MPPSPDLRHVYLVEDDTNQRDGLQLMLESSGFVVHPYESAEAFLAEHTPILVGCVVSDVRLPGMDGVGLINTLKQTANQLPVIVISGYAETPLVVEAMRAGAVDFHEKPLDPQSLIAAVHAATNGVDREVELRNEVAAAAPRLASLSERETEVFLRFGQGTPAKRIADEMGLSPKTVESHRTRLLEKLGLESPSALVRLSLLVAIYDPRNR
jgi:two-component system, LuxR family, response regulator FixJ